ncbi:VOC family protein [Sphingomonas bacterium]|uniref:VOC family protein n=1 Tax=Sphingomonas bacterium TaxID=1895847 RepID=UPI0015750F2E|nr:VOC family protein [Sphingomonas bacterium]
MSRPVGIHHIALSTTNMKEQLTFFTQVLGLELKALFWMHGVKGAWHSFLKLNDRSFLSFVHLPAMTEVQSAIGVTHAGNAGGVTAAGAMQHLSLRVDSPDDVLAMRDRIRSHGIAVLGDLDHGMCRSIYFAGPENLVLEIACAGDLGVEPKSWIDPEVVAEAGISSDELAVMLSPPPFLRPQTPVPQPEHDPAKPFLHYPGGAYARLLAMPDEEFTRSWSVPQPPVSEAA